MATNARRNPFDLSVGGTPGAVSLFFVGVFLTFAPTMLLTVLTPRDPFSWKAIMFFLVLSGLCGCLWALAGVSDYKRVLFPIAAIAQGLCGVLMSQRFLGDFALRPSGFSPVGGVCVLLIGAGYACFVTFIVRQGTKAVRLWSEMDLAARIHAHLVPPIALRSGSLDVAGRSDASSAMGGDLADAIELSDGTVELVLADVSGHGVRSGVVMAMLKALLHGRRAGSVVPLEKLFGELNVTLCELIEPGMFATIVIVRIRRDGTFTYASAGHPPLLLRLGVAGQRVECLGEGGYPLGIDRDTVYSTASSALRPGQALVLYSDGLVEVRQRDGRMLGFDRFNEQIANASGATAADLLESIFGSVRNLAKEKELPDDQTAVVAKWS